MKHLGNKVTDLKIAYIGGGSRGWAWSLMTDLSMCTDISGEVRLYDIDRDAAYNNEVIGNNMKNVPGATGEWLYKTYDSLEETLTGADFVIISILPATLEEMYSDVHTPEKYGVYQSVGDTFGPGGIVRAMRALPMFEVIAEAIKNTCPKSWVINYTNPMTLCVKTLYRVFPEIKAFGCCHEVFGTQKLLMHALKDIEGIEVENRNDIQVNPVSVNHFTWLTSAKYKNIDLFPVYKKFCEKYVETGYRPDGKAVDDNWFNSPLVTHEKVKMELFLKYGYIAAAGDRHLAEFLNGSWYLDSPERVKEKGFTLTSVDFRINEREKLKERAKRLRSGEEMLTVSPTGEEGISQIRAILGLGDLVTNVNMPNIGQIPNLPIGAVVETNAVFRADSVTPVMAGNIPNEIYQLISRVVTEQILVEEGIHERNLDKIYMAFSADPLMGKLSPEDSKKLFYEMLENTKAYLTMYDF